MTCREKLAMEHPKFVNLHYAGGCYGCPHDYGYMDKDTVLCESEGLEGCNRCWDRVIPGTEPTKPDIPWEQIRDLINDAMENRDRTVSVYFHPENGLSVNVYPWPDAEELYEQYKKGHITANDFRVKMGLPMMRNPEQFMKRSFLDQELHIPTPEPKTYETVEVPNTDDWK